MKCNTLSSSTSLFGDNHISHLPRLNGLIIWRNGSELDRMFLAFIPVSVNIRLTAELTDIDVIDGCGGWLEPENDERNQLDELVDVGLWVFSKTKKN